MNQDIAEGTTEEVDCPRNGPNLITVDGDKHLVHCDALAAFYNSDKKDGTGCLYLHNKSPERRCPLNGSAVPTAG